MVTEPTPSRSPRRTSRGLVALLCACLLVPGEGALLAQTAPAPAMLSPDQLDSLVAPIALYPDPLLAQALAAATYPLELIQLQQWLLKNPNLKDKALADAVARQPWDPAVQSMAPYPDAVKRLADDIQWTTDLGNAFLDQQSDVMDAVQRMRKKAKDKGSLASNEQQKVETKVIEQKTVIIVQPADPEIIYVPVYSPTVVYPPPAYPYPPIYYPPYYAGAAFVTFTAAVVVRAAVWGGAWGHCGWGRNDINININNNFNRNTNINTGDINIGNRGSGNSWQHNSQHRGAAPYSSSASANKYGGSTKGGASAQSRGGASASTQARGGAGTSQQSRSGSGGASASQQGRSGSGGASAGGKQASLGGGSFPSSSGASASNRSSGGSSASPSAASSSRGTSGGGFGSGGSSGFSGSSAKASSSRGASSYGGRSGGGGGRRR